MPKKINELPTVTGLNETDLFIVGNPTTGEMSKIDMDDMTEVFDPTSIPIASINIPDGSISSTKISGLPTGTGETFNTGLYTAMGSVTVGASYDIVQTSGYGAIGRGAARYVRTATAGAANWKFQSQDGQWWELAEPILNVDMFGAVGDGTTVNTTALQSAIDYATTNTGRRNNQGAMVWITNGQYVTSTLTMKSGVTLNGGRAKGKGGFSPGSSSGGGLKGHSSIAEGGFMIDSALGASGWAINGLQLIGTGSSSTSGGIRVQGSGANPGRDFSITNNTIKDWGIEAVLIEYASPFMIAANMIQGLNNRSYLLTRATATGAIKASGVDGTFIHNEFTGSANFTDSDTFLTSGAEMLLSAAYFQTLTVSKLTNNIYQVADCGLSHPGDLNTYTSERFDTNAGHGLFLKYGGSDNIFVSPTIERNSLEANNTYDGVFCDSGGRNVFTNPRFFAGAPVGGVTYNMRYFINDTKSDYNHNYVNEYDNPKAFTTAGTAYVNLASDSVASARVTFKGDAPLRRAGATPDVWGRTFIRFYNATETTITNFINGVPGQRITVCTDPTQSSTIIAHGTNIKLLAGSGTLTISNDLTAEFINRGTFASPIWIQI